MSRRNILFETLTHPVIVAGNVMVVIIVVGNVVIVIFLVM